MKKIGMVIAGAALALAVAAPAHADAAGFIDYMSRQGEDTSGVEYEVINLGDAICGIFEAGGSTDDAWDSLNQEDPAAWIVGAVRYLCPEYEYVLP